MSVPTFEFRDSTPTLICTACGKPARRVVIKSDRWDGNAVCGDESCAAGVIAAFGNEDHPAILPWPPRYGD